MLSQEYIIGNYLDFKSNQLHIDAKQRKVMVVMMQELNDLQQYKLETLFLAVSIADRYLLFLANRSEEAPCLVLLGVTSMMLAAKLEQFEIPSFDVMHHFLNKSHGIGVTLGDFVKLEITVIRVLQFNLNYVSPLSFLDRFLRIFELDLEENDE